jgi:hypothetical protein
MRFREGGLLGQGWWGGLGGELSGEQAVGDGGLAGEAQGVDRAGDLGEEGLLAAEVAGGGGGAYRAPAGGDHFD